MQNVRQKIFESAKKVEKWVEDHDYKGYEPFDGLSSRFRPLTFGNLFLDRLLLQLIRQSPINLRPLMGVKPQESTKGRGYMAAGYLIMLRLTGEREYRLKAEKCLDWLIQNKAPGYKELSWGNHFDFSSRGGSYSKHEPIIVWTALIGQAFLDGFEVLGENKYLEAAKSVCRWILSLPREKTETGTCISYLASQQSSIHNSNMLGAAMLARASKYIKDDAMLEVAREAMKYSCSRQQANGSWFYAEDPMNRWIDNFHTGYNLDSLRCYIENTGNGAYEDNLKRGIFYYKEHFFETTGRPKYYHNRTYPVDSQCAAQAVETLSAICDYDRSAIDLALKVTTWTIKNMQDAEGYFYYRQYPGIKAKTPMLHWAQATTYKALAYLLLKICRTPYP
jgi:rhamnogalacturonyl hydrolase YesR